MTISRDLAPVLVTGGTGRTGGRVARRHTAPQVPVSPPLEFVPCTAATGVWVAPAEVLR